jgi:hypothetical protein
MSYPPNGGWGQQPLPPDAGYAYPQYPQQQPQYRQYPQYGQQQPPMYGAPYPPQHGCPMTMPGTVMVARVLLFVLGGLFGLFALLVIGSASDPAYALGTMFVPLLPVVVAVVMACQFGRGPDRVRVGAIIAAVISALAGFASAANSNPLFFLPALVAVSVVVLLCMNDARTWFIRPYR